MIDINRSLYMDGAKGVKASGFDQTKALVQNILKGIDEFQRQKSR